MNIKPLHIAISMIVVMLVLIIIFPSYKEKLLPILNPFISIISVLVVLRQLEIKLSDESRPLVTIDIVFNEHYKVYELILTNNGKIPAIEIAVKYKPYSPPSFLSKLISKIKKDIPEKEISFLPPGKIVGSIFLSQDIVKNGKVEVKINYKSPIYSLLDIRYKYRYIIDLNDINRNTSSERIRIPSGLY